MNIGRYSFEGPYDPNKGFRDNFAAVYALVDSKPALIDVGQTGSINDRFPGHERQSCWDRNSEGEYALYIYKETSEQTRLQIESEIRKQFNPPCGER